jgi:type VI secretion system protein ImpH
MDAHAWRAPDSVVAETGRDIPESEAPADSPNPGGLFERGVYRRLLEEGYRFQFVQAVRLLELLNPEAPGPGETFDYDQVPIRLRPSVDLVFPPTDVKRVERSADVGSAEAVCVESTFLGLYGVDSPLPYYFYDALAREGDDTLAHRDFLDLFNHRFYAFFYRAWKKYRPGLYHRADGDDRHTRRFVSLAGLTPHAADAVPLPRLRFAAAAGLLAPRVRNAAGLEAVVNAFFDGLATEVVENMGRWVEVPTRRGLGDDRFQLGRDATVGERVFDRSGKFRLRLGPMSVNRYLALLPGAPDAAALHALVRLYVPDYLDFDVELRVRSADIPPTQLGDPQARLGLTTNLGQPRDPVIRRVVQYADDASARAPV